eukprot:TRINITY_DN8079_c0_g1_i2.p1 TRINITY_DN8079_c0_g1~~TRINITY_DN8079_c0_g1_i2.p1  ORF type:complete len:455 (+),score=75.99 TRINITY_DN8079_c0_g1_i2:187-1365(+)
MANSNILSELERFEQEMKELVAESQSQTSANETSAQTVLAATSLETNSETLSASAAADTVAQNSSISLPESSAPFDLVNGPSSSGSSKSSTAAAASTHVQAQISAAPVPSTSTWLTNGAGPTDGTSIVTPSVAFPSGASIIAPASVSTAAASSYFPMPFHLQQTEQYPQQQQQQYLMPQYSAQSHKPYTVVPQSQSASIQAGHYQYPSLYQPTAGVGGIYSLPQQQQAQQLFQKDAQTITPEALESVKAALASSESEHKAENKKKAVPRKAAGQSWEDPTLAEWPENDFRLFCGDLGNEVNDEVLTKAFSRYPSFNMARVVRDKRTGKTKGYGFVSFLNPSDLANALKEMNGMTSSNVLHLHFFPSFPLPSSGLHYYEFDQLSSVFNTREML